MSSLGLNHLAEKQTVTLAGHAESSMRVSLLFQAGKWPSRASLTLLLSATPHLTGGHLWSWGSQAQGLEVGNQFE